MKFTAFFLLRNFTSLHLLAYWNLISDPQVRTDLMQPPYCYQYKRFILLVYIFSNIRVV